MILVIFLLTSLAIFFIFYIGIFVSFAFKILLPSLFWGAPYVPSSDTNIEKMIELSEIKPGNTSVDLGAGDGRMVILFAQHGALAHGYEINPLLVLKANKKIRQLGLENQAFMHWGNFWKKDLSGFDIITVYGISFAMKKLEKKLKKELKPGAKVISNYFMFPSWQPTKKEKTIYLYKK